MGENRCRLRPRLLHHPHDRGPNRPVQYAQPRRNARQPGGRLAEGHFIVLESRVQPTHESDPASILNYSGYLA